MRKINITLLSILYLSALWLINYFVEITYQSYIFMTLISIIFILLFVIEYVRCKNENEFIEKIMATLDSACNNNFEEYELMNETIESKIQYKINRLFSITCKMKEDATTNKKELQSLITDISHQVKTPISNLKIYNDLLKRTDITDEERIDFLTNSTLQLDKLDFLMQSMIKISRLENGIILMNLKATSIYDTILQSIKDIYIDATNKNIEIEVKGDKELQALLDQKWTSEAITNILDNCIKYSDKNTKICIHIERNEFYAKISISDQGKGIDEKYYNNIFKRFFREPSVNNIQGLGIGLYLCRKILLEENGYITVHSILGKGSDFKVFLPLE